MLQHLKFLDGAIKCGRWALKKGYINDDQNLNEASDVSINMDSVNLKTQFRIDKDFDPPNDCPELVDDMDQESSNKIPLRHFFANFNNWK